MKINVKNEKHINEALNQINAKVRNADHQSVKAIIWQIEKKLQEKGLPKKLWEGLSFFGDINAQSFPNAYKWTPESTQFKLQRFASGWFMVDAQRMCCKERMVTMASALNDEQKQAVISNFYKF